MDADPTAPGARDCVDEKTPDWLAPEAGCWSTDHPAKASNNSNVAPAQVGCLADLAPTGGGAATAPGKDAKGRPTGAAARLRRLVNAGQKDVADAWRARRAQGIREPVPCPLPEGYPTEHYRRWGLTPEKWQQLQAELLPAHCQRNGEGWFSREDAFQDCFVHMLTLGTGTDDSIGSLLGFMRRVLRFSFSEHRRKYGAIKRGGKVKTLPFDVNQHAPQDSWQPDVAEMAEQAELCARLQHAIASLPGELRVFVELHYFDGFSPTLIAQGLGMNRGTVYNRLQEARECLRQVLAPAEVERIFSGP
jgi:RNA polymerase sigma factor (sigma-70 family)